MMPDSGWECEPMSVPRLTAGPFPAAQSPTVGQPAGGQPAGQVVVVHSPVGGSGKTLLALYLSYLAAGAGYPTVLVDLSPSGAIAPWLRIPRGSANVMALVQAARRGEGLDEEAPSGLLSAPGGGGRLHLALSGGPARMDQIQAGDAQATLQHLRTRAQVVVVDTGSELTDRVMGALLAADRILLTLTPQVVAGWQALELLDVLRTACVPMERLGVVFTRVHRGSRFGLEEYQQALNLPLLGAIPESPALRAVAEQGGPPALHRPRKVLRAFYQVAQAVLPTLAGREVKTRWRLSR